MKSHPLFAAVLLALPLLATAASAPSVDTAKQVITQRLLQLKPDGMSERQVLFESVKAGKPTGASYQFTATINLRDYGAGYPKNRYYGETCVSSVKDGTFTLWLDDKGQWKVDGAMTLPNRQCRPNPSEGATSIPLASIAGTAGPAGAPAAVAGAATPAGQMATGEYECWANGQARMLLNFSTKAAGKYTGSDGKSGSYSMDGTGKVSFKGGTLDGAMPEGFTAVYHAQRGRPTLSFRGRSGSEAAFCERMR